MFPREFPTMFPIRFPTHGPGSQRSARGLGHPQPITASAKLMPMRAATLNLHLGTTGHLVEVTIHTAQVGRAVGDRNGGPGNRA